MQLTGKYEFLKLRMNSFDKKMFFFKTRYNFTEKLLMKWHISYRRSYTLIISVSCLSIMGAQTVRPSIPVNKKENVTVPAGTLKKLLFKKVKLQWQCCYFIKYFVLTELLFFKNAYFERKFIKYLMEPRMLDSILDGTYMGWK